MSSMNPGNSPNGNGGGGNVRRLNKIPMMIAACVLALVMFGIVYALYSRSQPRTGNSSGDNPTVVGGSASADKIIAGVGDGIADLEPVDPIIIDNTKPTPDLPQQQLPPAQAPIVQTTQQKEDDEEAKRVAGMVREFRQRNYYEALVARTAIEESPTGKDANGKTADGAPTQGIPDIAKMRADLQTAALERSLAAQGIGSTAGGMEGLLESQDPNLRLRKAAFAAQTDNPYGYLPSVREPQLTPYEIRVGTIIPAVMVSGINSDLPGEIIAQVTHNVYDSKTGRTVLIPQGSKLIGRYDSHIAMGQERVMIAWYRLEFPDASVFNLGNMGAVDLAGYAGMHDRVNNHTWKIFKNAFLLSVIGAGTQIAIGDGGENENSPLNITKVEMGRQIGQVGTEIIRRNLNIQPTLEIRPGYRFNVMVNKDIILSPYKDY
ncbi:TrbI/VirB10 family protein [Cardiobacterium hominis]|uniref:TrbI/VirB10 family protein n=1 Tax=Cardiobacterium hominis TaxID=2718 RepID=UPI0028F0EC52|nr:TrbI/VirB10 family protein [Cardiobacterium hominis]